MILIRALAAFLVVVLLGALIFIVLAWRPSIDPIQPPAPSSFGASLIERGARLAAMGNCVSCHTATGGRSLAGGRGLGTSFGTVHSTNITPDGETGIGRWSLGAFARAMREGVDRQGRHLYPAFPYEHFRLMSDEDLNAVYAWLMTREPVRAEAPKNDLPFPLNLRMAVAGWKMLYLEEGRYQPDTARTAEWNRGAYLVQGVAHCASCHTPRNLLGGEKQKQHLAGGEVGDWHAPAINDGSPAPAPWTAERMYRYLRSGIDDVHAVPAGPMQSVVRNLDGAADEDLRAMAAYLASLNERPAVELEKKTEQVVAWARQKSAVLEAQAEQSASVGAGTPARPPANNGAAVYAGACASCHALGRSAEGGALHLSLGTALHLDSPRNLIHIIREGIVPPEGGRGPWMPGYAGALTEPQMVALVDYLRTYFAEKPVWRDTERQVRELSREQP